MVTDDELLQYIKELMPQLTKKHERLVDVCLRLQGLLRERRISSGSPTATGPKRDRAAYMRQYRAKHRHIGT